MADALTFDKWQERANIWVRRNFPDSGASEQFLGIVEEVGELAAAVEMRYSLDFDDRSGFKAVVEEIKDAIGDICIYLVNYCNFRDIEISHWVRHVGIDAATIGDFCVSAPMLRDSDFPLLNVQHWLGRLAHAQLKARQGIRGSEDEHRETEIDSVVEILVGLALYCQAYGFDLADIISKTSDHVFARDWLANPSTGEAPCPQTA